MAKHAQGFLKLVAESKAKIREVTIQDVKPRVDRREPFHLVDVREESEWAAGRLPSAVHIGKGVIERDIEAKIPDHAAPIVLYCGGDGGLPTYKRSRRGNAIVDRAVEHVLKHCGRPAVIEDFSPYGYDERQYCSPAFNLPVGLFERSQYGKFPEYHNSADNLEFVRAEYLEESYRMVAGVLEILENDAAFLNTLPKCEPQLGKRGLYSAIGGDKDAARKQMAMLWILNQSDGMHSLLDIAERAGIPFATLLDTAALLERNGLLRRAG